MSSSAFVLCSVKRLPSGRHEQREQVFGEAPPCGAMAHRSTQQSKRSAPPTVQIAPFPSPSRIPGPLLSRCTTLHPLCVFTPHHISPPLPPPYQRANGVARGGDHNTNLSLLSHRKNSGARPPTRTTSSSQRGRRRSLLAAISPLLLAAPLPRRAQCPSWHFFSVWRRSCRRWPR